MQKQQPGPADTNEPQPITSRLSYGTEKLQFGELHLPGTTGPYPVVILIHGGFWRAPYNLTLMTGLAEDLARHGIAAWNIEYRRVGDAGGGWPGTLQDVAQANDYLRTLAHKYPLDLQHTIAVGHSAGGHLALWLATRPQLPQPGLFTTDGAPFKLAGVVSLAGAIDLQQVWQLNLGNGAAAELLSGSPTTVPERYAAASPATHLPLGIPQVLIHGAQDDRVPLLISQNYLHKATAAGDNITLIELPEADHFVLIDPTSLAWHTTLEQIAKLL